MHSPVAICFQPCPRHQPVRTPAEPQDSPDRLVRSLQIAAQQNVRPWPSAFEKFAEEPVQAVLLVPGTTHALVLSLAQAVPLARNSSCLCLHSPGACCPCGPFEMSAMQPPYLRELALHLQLVG